MTLASGARSRILYIAEVTPGTTPVTPAMTVLRTTSRNIQGRKNMMESPELRPEAQTADLRHGFNQVEGSPGFALGVEAYDDMLEAALRGTWAAVVTSGTPDMGADSPTSTFTRSAGSWVTDNFRPGDIIETSGFSEADNNGLFRVTVVAATALTVDATLATEAQTAAKTLDLKGKRLDVSTTLKTFTFEKQFLDIVQYQPFRGVAINTLGMSIQPERVVTATIGLLGMSFGAMTGTSVADSVIDATESSPFSAFDGAMYEGGSSVSVVTGLDFSIDNGRTLQAVVGSKYSPAVFEGTADVTGTLTALFEDADLYNKFVNETESSLWLKLEDINGSDFLNIVMPRVKYTGGEIDPPQEGPVPQSLPFVALLNTTQGTSISLQRSNS